MLDKEHIIFAFKRIFIEQYLTILSIVTGLAVCFLILILPEEALARAGGGGGGGSGILTIIFLPIAIIYGAIMTHIANKKRKTCDSLLDKLAKIERTWDRDKINAQIEMAFFKIQEAWMKRDQDIAKDFMSERLYMKHKTQTDLLISQKRKNILDQINLEEAKIVEVADYEDDTKDRIWVYITGSMIDYVIDESTGRILSGKSNKKEYFNELWKFIRGPKGWVLDEIDQKVSISDLTRFKSFSEELK